MQNHLDEIPAAPSPEDAFYGLKQHEASHADNEGGDAAEPSVASQWMRNCWQGYDTKQKQRNHHDDPVDQDREHQLLHRYGKPSCQQHASDVASEGSEGKTIEEDARVVHRLNA